MRKLEVTIYKFDELAPEVREEVIDRQREATDLTEATEEFINQALITRGYVGLTAAAFAFESEDTEGSLVFSGDLSPHLKKWENKEGFEVCEAITSIMLSEDEIDDDTNPFGVVIEGEMDKEEKHEALEFIEEQLNELSEEIMGEAEENLTDVVSDETLIKFLRGFEFFAKGSLFDPDEEE